MLKLQVVLLRQNKQLTESKQQVEQLYSGKMDLLAHEYGQKMADYEALIKRNVDRAREFQGTSLIRRLL